MRSQGEWKYISWIATDPVPVATAERSTLSPVVAKGKIVRIVNNLHPDGGRTRTVILKLAREHQAEEGKLVILTPTRVVKAEVEKVLKLNDIPYGDSRAA